MTKLNLPSICCDLDSTLCDTSHRHHIIDEQIHADPPTATWVDYSMACTDDQLIAGTAALLRLLDMFYTIILITGRNEEARELTEAWLKAYDVPYDFLIMRRASQEGEHVHSNGVWKRHEIAKLNNVGYDVRLLIDDWPDVALEVGKDLIPCLVVVPPNNYAKIMRDANESNLLR